MSHSGVAALAAVLAATSAAQGVAGDAVDRSGTYRLRGKARVAARPLMDRDVDASADAELQPGARPGEVRARIATRGYACDLLARLEEGGALVFPDGQRCALEVRSPDARGHLDATLTSGHGALRGGEELELDLAWDVSGRLSVRAGHAVEVLGVEVPAAWTPETPVNGNARATVSGHRDRSRAGER